MSFNRLQGILLPSAPKDLQTRIPHLVFALASKRALRSETASQCRHASSASSSSSRRLPALPRRPAAAATPSSSPYNANNPTTHDPNQTPSRRAVKPYLYAISLFGAVIGLYASYYTASFYRSSTTTPDLPPNADVSDRWNRTDRDYDEEIEFSERAMFMGRKRRRLLGVGGEVRGPRVLEVSCGTGRNFECYDFGGGHSTRGEGEESRITELVFNDQSSVMLDVARGKWEALQAERRGKGNGKGAFQGSVKGVVGDAGIRGVIRRPEGGFDTIVQTMGVCSMQDPVAFLRMMNYLVRQPGEGGGSRGPDDQGGRILLLEHGRGYYGWINNILDRGAVRHAHRFGCWWNKDVEGVVRQSGLKVERIKRYHLGTTWEVVLRPVGALLNDEDRREIFGKQKEEVGGERERRVPEQKKAWWKW